MKKAEKQVRDKIRANKPVRVKFYERGLKKYCIDPRNNEEVLLPDYNAVRTFYIPCLTKGQ